MQLSERPDAVGRFAGPIADELAFLCRAGGGSSPRRQAEAAYRELTSLLADRGVSCADLTGETIFLRDIRRDLPAILEARARVFGDDGRAPQPTFIQIAPIDGAPFDITAAAIRARGDQRVSTRDVRPATTCPCDGCARSAARIVEIGDQTELRTTNIYGGDGDALAQAREMFRAAERLLADCVMSFRDVSRTWIYLRDIDRDYDALNMARREFFRERDVEPMPASTGVQGIPLPDMHHCCVTLQAVKRPQPVGVTPMSTPLLSEASTYGVDFSRGLKVVDANKIALHISGTASIDEGGETVHAGDFAAQASRMLDNISSLLDRHGASFDDLVSGVVYLTDPNAAPLLESICRERGFVGFPCARVTTPLCRRDLLCEAEAVVMLPLAGSGA